MLSGDEFYDDEVTSGLIEFARPSAAHQHLNRDGRRVTLCGVGFEYLDKVYDHRDGFDPEGGPKCSRCADAADAIQNG